MRALIKQILGPAIYERLKDFYLRIKLPPISLTSTEYWSRHHVTLDETTDLEASKRFIRYRRNRYIGISELMPTVGHDGKVILDYGCGPGIESASFGIDSHGINLICADVSEPSLAKANKLTDLHEINARFIKIDADGYETGLEDSSIDLIHCSGVLHHTVLPLKILNEFKRILKPDGSCQIMIYNYDSIFMHLYVSYILMVKLGKYKGLSKREAFRMSTDGPTCPISEAWTVDEFIQMCRKSNLRCTFQGTAFDCKEELANLSLRFEAIYNEKLNAESREFLSNLRFDERGMPLINSRGAGMYSVFKIQRMTT